MTGPAFDRVVSALEASGRRVTMEGPGRARSSCPAHDGDNRTALSIMDTADRVNLHCFTRECDGADVLAALGLTIRDRYHEPRGDALASYLYPGGFTVTRTMGTDGRGKDFRASKGWAGRPRPLYRGDRVPDAIAAGRPVYLVEGEEDVHAVEAAAPDVVAVSAPHGAASFAKVDAEQLRGAVVVAVVDRDTAGDRWAVDVRDTLAGVALAVRFTCAASGKDVSDHLAAGRTLAELEPHPGPAAGVGNPTPEPESLDALEEPYPEDDHGPRDAAEAAAMLYARLLAERVRALRVERDARAVIARDGRTLDPFDAGTLADVLARAAEPAARVEGLIPWQSSTLVVAQRKTGKTTLTLNLARCLLTGERFLGSLPVRPIAAGASVGFLNYEVSGAQLARWAEDAGVPRDRLFLVNLRGRRNPLAHPEDGDQLAELLRAHDVEALIVDPFGRAYSGTSQNDAGEVQAWLVALDRFARAEVGALDVILTAHAGWNGERTRGSSALEDWADSIVTLTRDEDSGDRFLRATGRDVELEEDRLDFDPITRTLSLSGGGGRKASAASRHLAELAAAVVSVVAEHGPLNGVKVAAQLRDAGVPHQKGEHSKALAHAVTEGLLAVTPGPRGAKVYQIPTPPTPTYPDVPQGQLTTYPDLPYRGGVRGGVPEDSHLPQAAPSSEPRLCADCGQPCAVNRVRCPECLRVLNGGAR